MQENKTCRDRHDRTRFPLPGTRNADRYLQIDLQSLDAFLPAQEEKEKCEGRSVWAKVDRELIAELGTATRAALVPARGTH